MSRASLLAVLALTPLLPANERKEPYKVRVVVHVERHRQLTDIFRDRVQRELHDGIQAAMGDLARVEVTDTHPKLLDIRREGLARALDRYRERSDYHTHFVLIDFSGTHYQIQTRTHDGLTGLPSPVVRKARTEDRDFVARTAAFLLKTDLGLSGTIESEPDAAKHVRVSLKGGDLGVDFGKWVKKGDVFQVVRADAGQVVDGAFLQVVEKPNEGFCTCRLHNRYVLDRLIGLRAVLLGTKSGPLRLRLLQEKPGGATGPLTESVRLEIRKDGFDGEAGSFLVLNCNSAREYATATQGTKGQFDRLAFVRVMKGNTIRARIPVPILDDGLTVLVVPAASEVDDLLIERFRSLQRNLRDARSVQNAQFADINKLSAKPELRAAAIKRTQDSLTSLEKNHGRLVAERDELKPLLAKMPPKDQPRPEDLTAIDDLLKDLKSGETDLRKLITEFEKIEKEENDPARKEWLIQAKQAEALEREAEIGQAIAIYEKAPEKFQTDDLKKHLARLKELWDPKGPKHTAARQFIYNVWPTLKTEDLAGKMAEARQAFEECKKVRDQLGPQRLKLGLEAHVDRMAKELDQLKPGTKAEDEKPAKVIETALADLKKLLATLTEYQAKNKP